MSPAETADVLGLSRNNVKQLLYKMHTAGEVRKGNKGRYLHPDTSSSGSPLSPDNRDNHDNRGHSNDDV